MTWPPLTPPPARATLKTRGKWSRPAFGLILRGAAELAHPDDQGPLEHPPALQVGRPARRTRVDLPGELGDPLLVLLVGVPAVRADLDEGHARLDEPAGEQAALAERVAAVGVTERRRLFVEVERLHPGREDHAGRLLVEGRGAP